MMCFWTAAIGYFLEEIQMDLNVRLRDQHYAFWVGKLVPKYREECEQDKGCVATLNSAKWLWFTGTPGLRSRLLQLDVHALVITHSLDAISPLRHTGAEANCRQESSYSYWPLLRGSNIDDDVTHSNVDPVFIQDSDFVRSLVDTKITISFYTFPLQFTA